MSTVPQLDQTTDGPAEPPLDGRTARAVRTRDALVDATIALVEEGDLRPTAPRIAERAGVSVRSVFQHFDDLESLFSAMGDRIVERLAQLVFHIDPSEPLEDRIAGFVGQRCRINEAISPINRAAILHAPTSETIGRQFQTGHAFFAAQLAEVFAPEIEARGEEGAALSDALLIACSWSTWNLLRTLEGRSVEGATDTVLATVHLLLGAPD